MDAVQCALEVLGGACGAVAGCLMLGTAVLPSEVAIATGLPEHTVRCMLEILTKYRFAKRNGVGYTARKIPAALAAAYAANH